MSAKFEIYEDKSGKFRFRLKVSDGTVVAVSKGYETKKSALKDIEAVQENAKDADIVEIEKRKKVEYKD